MFSGRHTNDIKRIKSWLKEKTEMVSQTHITSTGKKLPLIESGERPKRQRCSFEIIKTNVNCDLSLNLKKMQ